MTDSKTFPTAPNGVTLPTLPDQWQWITLDQLLERIEAGRSFRCDERPPLESEHGVVKVSAVTWGTYDEQESKTITDAERIDEAYLIRPGDFLFSRANTIQLVGASVIVHATTKQLLLSDKILRFVFATDLKQWVNWLFKSKLGRSQIEALSTGNQESMRNIGQQRIGQICVPVAPPQEMQRIVSKIDELFSRIDEGERALERVQTLVERYRQSVLKAAVTGELTRDWRDKNKGKLESGEALLARILKARREAWEKAELDKMKAKGIMPTNDKWKQKYEEPAAPDTTALPYLPANWCWVLVDALCFVTKLAGFEYTKFVRYSDDGDLSVIKAENAGPLGFRRTEFSHVHTDSVSMLKRSVLSAGDLLMVFVGAGTGNVARVPNDQTYFLGPNIAMLRPESPSISGQYLEHFLRSPLGNQLTLGFSKAVAQPSLSMGAIRQIPVAVPPIAEQQSIVDAIEKALTAAQVTTADLRTQKQAAQALRQSILKSAFSGQLVHRDSTDEPAIRLLERIAAERDEAPAKPKRGRKPKTSEPA